ncbi:hypothetical protein LIER_24351 [Lithospermum erythrorhizon]|uniref:Reverse transcriptase zinc-binding domain-containing protein n=1 Tax=Lithospermum erythrorhizon TaxID=34254 RepID=A0AAV3R4H5_LITER
MRLKGVSVWAYKKGERDPWYLNNILKVRPLVKQRLQVSVGNREDVSFWHDPWCVLGPVWDYLDDGERASLQVPSGAKLSEVEWVMPGARRQTMRLMQNKLSTKDRLCRWGMEVDPHCVLCGGLEMHDHLFFECPYAAYVWRLILQRLGEYRMWVEGTMGGASFKQRIKQVAFVSTVAMLWEERNLRCFQGIRKESGRVEERSVVGGFTTGNGPGGGANSQNRRVETAKAGGQSYAAVLKQKTTPYQRMDLTYIEPLVDGKPLVEIPY